MNKKIIDLVTALMNKSKEKNVLWEKTNSDSEFQVLLDSGITVTTDSFEGESNWHNFDLGIYNAAGVRIFYVSYGRNESLSNYQFLEALYNSAKDAYYKVDETIDGIMNELDSKETIGNKVSPPSDDFDPPF